MLQMSGGQYNVPIVFRGPNGTAGQLAATHSQSFESMYAHIPVFKVITPSNPYDAKGLLKAAIRDNDPVVFMESEKMYGDKGMVPDGEYIIPIGVADIKREGTDVTLVSFGKIMKTALLAAEEFAKEGISVEVIDLRTIRPLDIDCIVNSVKKTNRLIILEESWPVASISTEITYRVQRHAFDYLDAPIRRITQTDTPFAFATTLIDAALPGVDDVVRVAKEVCYKA
jgi:pyruvate dehydrogenase E1 component beta subunit